MCRRSDSGSKVILVCWLLWILIMVVFSNGYKGMVFSFMTKNEAVSWPANLLHLVKEYPSYTLVTNAVISRTRNDTRVVVPFLKHFFAEDNKLKGYPGKDFPIEYHILNTSTIHNFTNSTLNFVSNFIWNAKQLRSTGHHKGEMCPSPASPAREEEAFVSLITYFIKDLVASIPNSDSRI